MNEEFRKTDSRVQSSQQKKTYQAVTKPKTPKRNPAS